MEVYLDNAATTKCMEAVIERMNLMMRTQYGNPSSLHMKGIEAEKELNGARMILSKMLRVDPKEIIFTSGGTESNNLALIGLARAYRRNGMHIITTAIEHPSVDLTLRYLEEEGFEITRIPVNAEGLLDLGLFENSIREDTILVAVIHVNNEIGAIQDLETIGKIIKLKNPKTLFHVDAIQSFGKLTLLPEQWKIDTLSLSGHKIYVPKGIGALYIRKRTKIIPLIYGGSQQGSIRSGTENTPGIVGLSLAASLLNAQMNENRIRLQGLKNRLAEGILNTLEGTHINGATDNNSAYHILNIRFDRVKAEVLLHALESKGIFVSTGAACSSNKPEVSKTLKAIGLSDEEAGSSIRFSFSIETTEAEIDYTLEQISEIVPQLRRFVRR